MNRCIVVRRSALATLAVAAIAPLLLANCATPQREVTLLMDGAPVQTRRIPDADEDAQRTEFDVTDPQSGQRCVVVLTLSGTAREPSGSKIYGHCRTDCRHQSLMGELAVSNVDHSGGFKFTCNPEVMIQGRNL